MQKSIRKQVVISGGRLGLGGVLTHLNALCLLLRDRNVDVWIFARASDWSPTKLSDLRRAGVRIIIPPRIFWKIPFLANITSCIMWWCRFPSEVSSLYCIGAGKSHAFLRGLCEKSVVSIYHEIVAPPSQDS